MKPTLNEKFLAYLALFSGLFLSLVAEYYSILGLTAIFAAATIPVIIMGIALGLGKITATLWLKQNWSIAPWSMRGYLFTAIIVLMLVTSLGIFGFLSKAHSDQSLVSGDVLAKISIYDEKIKTEKENIEANRKALKQMDEAVDQVMGRSSSETGADKAVVIRRSQQKERARLQQDITQSQQTISSLNEQRAPIAAEVRKVEAEVGPIKYIATFIYGDTDQTILEKAVTWVIIILIVVFDPMAVILLLSSQVSFQDFRKRLEGDALEELKESDRPQDLTDAVSGQDTVIESTKYEFVEKFHEPDYPADNQVNQPKESILDKHPYLLKGFDHFENLKPLVYVPEIKTPVERIVEPPKPVIQQHETTMRRTKVFPVVRPASVIEAVSETYIQNEEQAESNLWSNTVGAQTDLEQIENHAADIMSGRTNSEGIPKHLQDPVTALVEYHAANILAGKMHTGEVPEHIWEKVKAKL